MKTNIYLGNQIPCFFHALKSIKKSNKEEKNLILAIKGKNTEHLNLLLWSRLELDLFYQYLGISENKNINIHLSYIDLIFKKRSLRIGPDGLSNLIEVIRASGEGSNNIERLIKFYPDFLKSYQGFMSKVIKFGQYNTIKIDSYFEDLPKSYKEFFNDILKNPFGESLFSRLNLVLGEQLGYSSFNDRKLSILYLSKLMTGIYLVDFNDEHLTQLPTFVDLKMVNNIKVEDLGNRTTKIAFDGYEGAEILSYDNIHVSDLFSQDYLKIGSLKHLKYQKKSVWTCGEDFKLHRKSLSKSLTPSVFYQNNPNTKKNFIEEFRGSLDNNTMQISSSNFLQLNYVRNNSFGISPYLTYLFSSN